jgi:hypothetical protein
MISPFRENVFDLLDRPEREIRDDDNHVNKPYRDLILAPGENDIIGKMARDKELAPHKKMERESNDLPRMQGIVYGSFQEFEIKGDLLHKLPDLPLTLGLDMIPDLFDDLSGEASR